jgi:hypothetical protein
MFRKKLQSRVGKAPIWFGVILAALYPLPW